MNRNPGSVWPAIRVAESDAFFFNPGLRWVLVHVAIPCADEPWYSTTIRGLRRSPSPNHPRLNRARGEIQQEAMARAPMTLPLAKTVFLVCLSAPDRARPITAATGFESDIWTSYISVRVLIYALCLIQVQTLFLLHKPMKCQDIDPALGEARAHVGRGKSKRPRLGRTFHHEMPTLGDVGFRRRVRLAFLRPLI